MTVDHRSGAPSASIFGRSRDWVEARRDRLLLSPRFQRWASRFPLTRPVARRYSTAAFDLCAGFVYSQALHACIRLRLLERVREHPLAESDLVELLPLPVPQSQLLIRAAIALDLLSRRSNGRIGLGILGASIVANPSISAMVQHHAAFYADLMDPVARLDGTAQPGRLAAFWPYAGASDSAENAPQNGDPEAYSALMTSSLAMLADDILDAYPFGQHHRIMDVGGGEGEFLIALARRHAAPRLLSFDLPAVAARATQRVERAGLAGRIAIASGNFLDCDLPEAADLITLVRIAHDHHDDNLLRLLSAIRRALAPGGALVIAEPMSGDDEARRVSDVYFAFYLHAMGSGRVRRPEELEALVRRAGFTRFRRYKTARPMLVSLVAAS